jgi:hypothetical protein
MSMQASSAGHPGQEELMAFGDGEASADVVEHVKACATCTERAAGYTQIQSDLRRSLFRFDCPEAHTLGEYALSLLDPEQQTSIARHATTCDECSSELHTLRVYLAAPSPITDSLVDRARRLVATLVTQAPGLAYGGLRGSADTSTRVYQVDDVTVTVAPGPSKGSLLGLVTAGATPVEQLAGREVRLLPASGQLLVSKLDDIGNFEFADLPPSVYVLEVDLPGSLVIVEELRLH